MRCVLFFFQSDLTSTASLAFLSGWCYKKGQLLLVYEYMPNGSLDQHLFRRGVHEQRWPVLSWARRYAIVGDVAAGLHYVHHEYTRMVLHRDVKASNVLLDASFRARLGDFGLARVLDDDREAFTDLHVAGTCGFIAPEYSVGHKASRETDVFAFGAAQRRGPEPRCRRVQPRRGQTPAAARAGMQQSQPG